MLSRVHPKLCLSDALGFYLWIQSDWQSKLIITLKYFLSFSCLSFNLVVSSSLRCYKYFMNSVLTGFSFMTFVFFGLCGTPYCPRLPYFALKCLCFSISKSLSLQQLCRHCHISFQKAPSLHQLIVPRSLGRQEKREETWKKRQEKFLLPAEVGGRGQPSECGLAPIW